MIFESVTKKNNCNQNLFPASNTIMVEKDDIVLIKKILAGDINAFTDIVNRYKRKGFNLAYRICRNRENSEEILQDVFLNIYLNLDKFKFSGKFSTWFYRIVYNQSISYIRKTKNLDYSIFEPDGSIDSIDEEKSIVDKLTNSESVIYLEQALGELIPEDNALLHLYYYDGRKIPEISVITRLSESVIKIRLFRARKKLLTILKRLLNKEFIEFYG